MSDKSRSGLTIPGYQPVEKVGNAPSFGVWIRALQTRMNRRVLLKVLPPGAARLSEFFAREIALAVRLDGRGYLAVIDEGTAGEVRYLVLDEASSTPITAGTKLSVERWNELANRLETIYRLVESERMVLAPIDASSFRQLPNGEVVTADLGWVAPYGEGLPNLDTIPEDLRGAAVAAHNRLFLAVSLENLARATGLGVPRPFRKCLATLAESGASEVGLPTSRVFAGVASQQRGVPIVVQILIGVLIVAAGAFFASQWIQPRNGGVATDGADTDVDSPDDDGEDPDNDVDEMEERRLVWLAQQRDGERALLLACGARDLDSLRRRIETDPEFVGGVHAELSAVIEQHPQTLAASIAGLLLRTAWSDGRLRIAMTWEPYRSELERAMREGRITDADRQLIEARRSLGARPKARLDSSGRDDWHRWAPLSAEAIYQSGPLEVRHQLLALVQDRLARSESARASLDDGEDPFAAVTRWREELDRVGNANRTGLKRVVDQQLQQFSYRGALDAITAAKPGLLIDDRPWADKLEARVEAEALRYLAAKKKVRGAVEAVLDLAAAASEGGSDWAAARASLEESRPDAEFERLVDQHNAWFDRLRAAESAAKSLSVALGNRLRSGSKDSYTVDEESVRGSVRSVREGRGFELKVDGRRDTRSIDFVDLSLATLRDIDPNRAEADWLLMLFFLGDLERAIAGARAMTPAPEWLAAAEELDEERRTEQFQALVAQGDSAHQAGRHEEAYDVARSIVTSFPPSVWTNIREQKLVQWVDGRLEELGPRDAFHAYEELVWDPVTRMLTIEYDFQNEGAKADWGKIRLERTHRIVPVRGGVNVRGSAFLAPDGATDLFEGVLSAEMRCEAMNADAPNLNLVLWSGRPKRGVPRGILGGLGTRPLPKARIEYGDGTGRAALLPATILGRVADFDDGRSAEKLYAIDTEPTIRTRARHVMSLGDDGSAVTLRSKSSNSFGKSGGVRHEWSGASLPAEQRRGTVEIRTYTSGVEVRAVRVEGRLSSRWWRNWKRARIAQELQ